MNCLEEQARIKKIVNKLSDNQPSSRKSTPGKGEAIFSSEEISLKYLHKF